MRSNIIDYVCTCDPCQKIKHNRGGGTRFLLLLEIPLKPIDNISLDLITGLPRSSEKDAILVVVDKLMKYLHFIAMTAEVTMTDSAALLFQQVIKHFGLPEQIIGDQDP